MERRTPPRNRFTSTRLLCLPSSLLPQSFPSSPLFLRQFFADGGGVWSPSVLKAIWLAIGVMFGIVFILTVSLSIHIGSFSLVWKGVKGGVGEGNALVRSSVGLEGVEGRVAAFGDFNQDKYTDIFIVHPNRTAVSVMAWDQKEGIFFLLPLSTLVIERGGGGEGEGKGETIENVVSADFNNDHHLDILVECVSSEYEVTLMCSCVYLCACQYSSFSHALPQGYHLMLFLGQTHSFQPNFIWEAHSVDQVLVFDSNSDLWLDLYGEIWEEEEENEGRGGGNGKKTQRVIWKNNQRKETSFDVLTGVFGGFSFLPFFFSSFFFFLLLFSSFTHIEFLFFTSFHSRRKGRGWRTGLPSSPAPSFSPTISCLCGRKWGLSC